MSQATEESIRIAASPGEVTDVIVDVEAYPEWSSDIRAVTVLEEDEHGWPEQVQFTVDAGPVSDTYVLDYTWDVDDDGVGEVSWTLARSNKLTALDGSYVIAPDGEDTLVTYRLAVALAVPLPGMLRRKAEKSIVSTALDGLRSRVEG